MIKTSFSFSAMLLARDLSLVRLGLQYWRMVSFGIPCITRLCLTREETWVKRLSQIEHRYGLIPANANIYLFFVFLYAQEFEFIKY